MTALVPMLALLAWLIVPAALAALTLDRMEAAARQREAVARSRRTRQTVTTGGTDHA